MRNDKGFVHYIMVSVYMWLNKYVSLVKEAYLNYIIFPLYVKSLPRKAEFLRKKTKISVAFVVSDLAEWKTELLYARMQVHPRFNPIILVVQGLGVSEERTLEVVDYCKGEKYNYENMDGRKTIWDTVHPDIIFYQKPYCNGNVADRYGFHKNLKSLFCYADYGFFTENSKRLINTKLHNISWQLYFENETTYKERAQLMDNHGVNGVVTGSPISEMFMRKDHPNPWKYQGKQKKRIIWAPHHSIPELNLLFSYSTFLHYYEFMLKMADDYKDFIQIAFKPHPLLYLRLLKIWPEERVEAYFNEWNTRDNTQLELGDYVGLMMHSDAMIHDCVSFRMEYHYTQNPVMFLEEESSPAPNINEVGKIAYNLHYKGHSEQDIKEFIDNIIKGIDPLKKDRVDFYNQFLLPPNSKTASENIIDSILG